MSALKVIFVLVFLFSAQIVFAQDSAKNFVEGELLVKFKNGTDSAMAERANSEIGATVVEEFPALGWQRVKVPVDFSVDRAVSFYRTNAEVEFAQPNFYYHLLSTPNDTSFGSLYGMAKISAPAAWDFTTGSPNVVVADIDTGLRYTHEDLAANAWTNPGEVNNNGVDDDGNGFIDDFYGFDFFYNDSNPYDDAGGHGTHTAGTIGAVGNNARGVVGVNWNVKIMAIKIYSPNGSDTTSAMLVNAYNYITLMKNRGVNIRVTNNSYGGCGEACGYDQITKDALDAMGDAGILNVFAAGNNGTNNDTTPFYPAAYTSPSVLTVASSNSTDARSGFSNYGVTSVDLAAPGSSILSTFNGSNSSYATLSGTSMASPHVAGAAALLSSYNPNLSVASLKATLMNTVDPLTQWNGLVRTGGRLNVSNALQNQTQCTYSYRRSPGFLSSGGNINITVKAPNNCDFSVVSLSPWITVTAGNPGIGSTTITVAASPNSGTSRIGVIKIAGQTVKLNQGGTP